MVCKSLVNKEKKMKRQSLCSRKADHILQRHQASQQCKLLQRRDSRLIQYVQSHSYFLSTFRRSHMSHDLSFVKRFPV